jgi:DNA-binding MarR family transcriptional regulator
MFGGSTPGALADRFARLVERLGGDMAAAKAQGQQRALLAAVGQLEPATLNKISAKVKRGAPAVSRAIDVLVRAGLIDRQPDPDNRRRLALRLTEAGREQAATQPSGSALAVRLERLAHSELRAIERAIEILER